ncbi:MAG: NAD+ synthase [Sedimentisphaerales bacterium]|nr:NAD+ synthase [Sedimentisphaerales bacterium]
MKIALAQINPTVGDLKGNMRKIVQEIETARNAGCQLIVFSELSLTGYPPRDLLLKPRFVDLNISALDTIAQSCQGISALVGYVSVHTGPTGKCLHNTAALLQEGKVVSNYYKRLLPTYDVFDETRYFKSGSEIQIIEFGGMKIGLTICEDIWRTNENGSRHLYDTDPFAELARAGAQMVINMSASPFVMDKHNFRLRLFGEQAMKYCMPLLYVNQVGGNDELVFDGVSCVFDQNGQLVAQARDFAEDLLIIDTQDTSATRVEPISEGIASVYKALVLGLRDYVRKCRFESVVLGLSGGIDSAVVAALAVEALGADRVFGVAMPSRFSSEHSVNDARDLAANLAIDFQIIPIELSHRAMEETLSHAFAGTAQGITEENIQARIRGNLLMALSNKFGHLLLTTGNKSELAVGYCTMYGDMCGGLAVISDVPKTMVYELAHYINRNKEIIPTSTITKAPSAELRPDQKDQDSLPPYDVLDDILHRYVEQENSMGEIIKAGFDANVVERVVKLVDRNEYKRKQAAPGLKVTSRAFGIGRRMPIAQGYEPI